MATLFLSAVSEEFGTYQQQLRHRLLQADHDVRTLDDVSSDRDGALDRLESLLKSSDAVICLIGDRHGPEPTESERPKAPSNRHSYAQWAYLLARKLGKPIHVFCPTDERTPRDSPNRESKELTRLQQKFIEEEIQGKNAEVHHAFGGPGNLVEKVFSSLESNTSRTEGRKPASSPEKSAASPEPAEIHPVPKARTPLASLGLRILTGFAAILALAGLGTAYLALQKAQTAEQLQRSAEVQSGRNWLLRAKLARGTTDAGFYASVATGFVGAGRPDEAFPAPSSSTAESTLDYARRNVLPHLASSEAGGDPYPRYLRLDENPTSAAAAAHYRETAPPPFLWSSPFSPRTNATDQPDEIAGHADPVTAVAFHPDGKLLASAGQDGSILLWDQATRQLQNVLSAPGGPVIGLCFNRDGTLLASAGADPNIHLWDLADGGGPILLSGHEDSITALAFSPDAKVLASASQDGTVRIWHLERNEAGPVLQDLAHPAHCLAFHPQDASLALGGKEGIELWHWDRQQSPAPLAALPSPVRTLAYHPDGTHLASGGDDAVIRIWEVSKQREWRTLPGHSQAITDLVYSPTGTSLLSASADASIRHWLPEEHRELAAFTGHSGKVASLSWSPDGRHFASGGADQTLKLWSLQPLLEFNWLRYLEEEWVQFDGEAGELVWKQQPEGLSLLPETLDPNSWLGIVRSETGAQQTRRLLLLALEAEQWDTASLLWGGLTPAAQVDFFLPIESNASERLRETIADLNQSGHPELARQRMKQGDLFLARDPDWARMRGTYLEEKGNPEAALVWWRKLDDREGWTGVARLSTDGSEALDAWRRVIASQELPAPEDYLGAGNRALSSRDEAAAREFFQAGLGHHPEAEPLRRAFAAALIEFQSLEEALAILKGGSPAPGSNPEEQLTHALADPELLPKVLGLLRDQVATLRTSGSEADLLEREALLISLLERSGQLEDAILVRKEQISHLQQRHQGGRLSAPLNDLAEALQRAGRNGEALTVMQVRIDLLKTQTPGAELLAAWEELASALSAAKRFDDAVVAREERLQALRSLPDTPLSDALLDLANALKAADRRDEAFPLLDERVSSLQKEGRDPVPALRELAHELDEAGRIEDAWAAYQQVAETHQTSVDVLTEIALWGATRGKRDEALALFSRAESQAENESERALVGRRHGWSLIAMEDFEDAFRAFGMAKAQLESSPDSARLIESQLLSGLAAAFWLTDRKGASLDEYETLWENQRPGERWEDADWVGNRDLPAAGRRALLELHAIWHERMHMARTARL